MIDFKLDISDHYRSVEVSKMRQLMKYRKEQYIEDWNLAIALAILMATGSSDKLEVMLDSCFKRMMAYKANNPEERPF